VKLRLKGYQRALAHAGLVAEPSLQFGAPFDIDRAAIAARAAIATAPPFDAVFCATDVIALNVIVALNAAGKRVPEDVSVVGYDDIALASSLGQALTTVSQNVAVGGRILVSLLLNILDNRPAENTTIAPELKVRSTCRAR
jgi:DNA-binding LacI/PurR family transcriptional regulator